MQLITPFLLKKKSNAKRIVALMLCVVCMVTILAQTAFAQNTYKPCIAEFQIDVIQYMGFVLSAFIIIFMKVTLEKELQDTLSLVKD